MDLASLATIANIGSHIANIGSVAFGSSGGPSKSAQRAQVRLNREAHQLNKDIFSQNVRQYDEQFAWQKELAGTAIQKRVADAQAAGVHPALAMGAAVSGGGSPVTVGQSGTPLPGVAGAREAANYKWDAMAEAMAQLAEGLQSGKYERERLEDRRLQKVESESRAFLNYANAQRQMGIVHQQFEDSGKARNAQNSNSRPTSIAGPGWSFKPNLDHTQAEVLEQEYGGMAGEIYGLLRSLGEAGQYLGKAQARQHWADYRPRRNQRKRLKYRRGNR